MSRNAQLILLLLLGWVRPAGAAGPADSPAPAVPARVVQVAGFHLLNTYLPVQDRVDDAFNRGLLGYTHATNLTAAWLTLVKTNDIIGLKVFSEPGPLCGTRPALITAVVRSLEAAGLPPSQIVLWDKRTADLQAAGYYELGRDLGVDVVSAQQAGYDSNTFYLPDSPIIGQLVWGDLEFGQTNREAGKRSFVSNLLSRRLTKNISLAPLMNEDAAGLCGHFFSLALGSVDNTHRFENDPGRLAVALPEIVAQPAVGDRTVLYVTDALLGQYQGGPAGYLQFSAILSQIWLSRDPVALDTLGLQELSRLRHQQQVPEWRSNLDIYTNAALLQLGQNNPDLIPVETVR